MITPKYEFVSGRMAQLQAEARESSRGHRLAAARRAHRRADKAARRAARLDATIF